MAAANKKYTSLNAEYKDKKIKRILLKLVYTGFVHKNIFYRKCQAEIAKVIYTNIQMSFLH